MDVNSDILDAARSPQVVATTTLARRVPHGTPANLGQNFCARRFSTRKSPYQPEALARRATMSSLTLRVSVRRFDHGTNVSLISPICQVDSVRTKATRTDPAIFVIFVRTPVFSRTIFVRTKRQLRAHKHHLRAHSDTYGWAGAIWTTCASSLRSHDRTSLAGRLVELLVAAQYVGFRFPFCSRIEARQ
jgi:hypothetical protein